jgi:hypothetical protein
VSAHQISLIFAAAGPLALIAVLARFKPGRRVLGSSCVAGLFAGAGNILLEGMGAKFDIYHVSGAMPIFNSPMSLNLWWATMGAAICTCYGAMMKKTHGALLVKPLFITAGIAAGWIYDYSAWRYLGMLKLGANGTAVHIAFVWIVMIPATIYFFDLVLEKMKPE